MCGMVRGNEDRLSVAEVAFAESIRGLREARRWTQADVAARVQQHGLDYFSQTTLSRIENRARPARLAEALALSLIFEMPIPALVAQNQRYLAFQRAQYAAREVTLRVDSLQPQLGALADLVSHLQADVRLLERSSDEQLDENVERLIATSMPGLQLAAAIDVVELSRAAVRFSGSADG